MHLHVLLEDVAPEIVLVDEGEVEILMQMAAGCRHVSPADGERHPFDRLRRADGKTRRNQRARTQHQCSHEPPETT
jgi:hypothetical protein